MTGIVSIVVDANDHIAQARWWSEALRTPVLGESDDQAWIKPADAPEMDFVPVVPPKTSKNRVHLDLATYSADEHVALVSSLVDLGARRIDVGQPQNADWVVLADPEGDEFCVMEPRPAFDYSGPIGVVGIDTAALAESADFWELASGWRSLIREPTWAVFHAPSGLGPIWCSVQRTSRRSARTASIST